MGESVEDNDSVEDTNNVVGGKHRVSVPGENPPPPLDDEELRDLAQATPAGRRRRCNSLVDTFQKDITRAREMALQERHIAPR